MSGSSTRPASVHSVAMSSNGGTHSPKGGSNNAIDVLLLGSGWTSSFLLPELFQKNITFAYTNRSGLKPDSYSIPQHPIKWTCPDPSESRLQWRKNLKALPEARLVVLVLPLKDQTVARELLFNYEALLTERGSDVKPKWVVLGSTGNWGPGIHTSQSPITSPTPRSSAEDVVLSTHKTYATILNLAGLYGGSTRHPINWVSKIADSQEKLASKSSLHLIHGKDVAKAILAVWESVEQGASHSIWGKRWIVTDGNVYDWWQLISQLPIVPTTQQQLQSWVGQLRKEYNVKKLPRDVADPLDPAQQPPQYLDRSLSSAEFWEAIGQKPSQGPAYQTDVPISTLTGLPVSTSQLSATPNATPASNVVGKSKVLQPFIPSISKQRIDDLVSCLKHDIAREEKFPVPSIFEGRKERFGMTHQRFHQLRQSWLEYLTNSGSSPHDKTWSSHWKEIASYSHGFFPLPGLITSKHSQGTLDGLHYVRVSPSVETASQRKVMPLLFLHGWPGSFLEGLNIAKPLANPGVEVPLSVPAFDVVVPSHPGYAWSGSPVVNEDEETGEATSPFSGPDGDILVKDVADLADRLMVELGFSGKEGGYVVQAGDWGTKIARSLGVNHTDNVRSILFNYLPCQPPLLSPPLIPESILSFLSSKISPLESLVSLPRWMDRKRYSDSSSSSTSSPSLSNALSTFLRLPKPLDDSDSKKVLRGLEFETRGRAYAIFHDTRPSTLGLVMHSSPSSYLAWIGEKFDTWTDNSSSKLSDEEILTSLTLWFCTDTMPRSLLAYRNLDVDNNSYYLTSITKGGQRQEYIKIPIGYSDFPFELSPTPVEWIKKQANLVWHRQHQSGGHFAALEKPVELIQDIREFFQHHA